MALSTLEDHFGVDTGVEDGTTNEDQDRPGLEFVSVEESGLQGVDNEETVNTSFNEGDQVGDQSILESMAMSLLDQISYLRKIPITFSNGLVARKMTPLQVIEACEEREELRKIRENLMQENSEKEATIIRINDEKEKMDFSLRALSMQHEEIKQRNQLLDYSLKKAEGQIEETNHKMDLITQDMEKDRAEINSLKEANGNLTSGLSEEQEKTQTLLSEKETLNSNLQDKDKEIDMLKEKLKSLEKENQSLDEENRRIMECQDEEEKERGKLVEKTIEIEKQIYLKKEANMKKEIENLKKENDQVSGQNEELLRKVNLLESAKECLERRAFFKRKRESLGGEDQNQDQKGFQENGYNLQPNGSFV